MLGDDCWLNMRNANMENYKKEKKTKTEIFLNLLLKFGFNFLNIQKKLFFINLLNHSFNIFK